MRTPSLACAVTALTVSTLVPVSAAASRVVYVNTEPVTVSAGANDPSIDEIAVNGFMDTDIDGWVGASPAQVEELLVLMRDASVDFDIVFTTERPSEGPYDMVVFGSAADHMSAFGGTCSSQVGLSDCSDQGGVSIGFMFWGCLDAEQQLDPKRVAFHALGALGYSWGLENIAGVGQIMAGYSTTALRWGDACANIDGTSSCTHTGCAAGQQNSAGDLYARFGPRVDDGPPTVTVLEPAPGDVTEPFDVVVEIDDAFGGLSAQLELVGVDVPPVLDDTWPYRWNGLTVGAGPVTLRITGIDADGNETAVEVPICVGGGCPDTGDGDGDGDGAGDSSGDGDGDPSTGGDTGVPGPAVERGEESGCAVTRAGGGAGSKGTLALLALLGLVARRRRDRS
jgi:MYXO-CTERM domain-containing protein